MNIKETAQKYSDYIIETRRYLHMHPELSTKEYETSKFVQSELDKIGVPYVQCGLETGVLATIKGGKPGKTILIRGDGFSCAPAVAEAAGPRGERPALQVPR